MTGILKIDLPDDFEKGDCITCKFGGLNFYDLGFGNEYDFECRIGDEYSKYNCPLEIQDEPEEDRCIGCIHRGVFNDMGICLKCNDYNFYK